MGTYYIISIHAVSVFILEPWMFLRYHLIFDTIPMIYSSVFFFFFFCSYGLMRQETHRLQPLKRKRLISLKSILRYKCVQKQSFCKLASGLLQKNNTELMPEVLFFEVKKLICTLLFVCCSLPIPGRWLLLDCQSRMDLMQSVLYWSKRA